MREWSGIFYAEGHNILLIEAGDMFREAPDTLNFNNDSVFFIAINRRVRRFFFALFAVV